jgi:hypothetical protein
MLQNQNFGVYSPLKERDFVLHCNLAVLGFIQVSELMCVFVRRAGGRGEGA